ncbi:MAG: hypothetical protein AAF998_02795 [Bacteroidota bacterium]
MEAATKRKIRDGRRFDRFFPKADVTDETIKSGAVLEDTLEKLPEVVRDYKWQAARIAAVLEGKTLRETCRNIWNFCYQYIQYRRDKPGTEQLRTPARSWHDRKRGIDCDCYTILISSILHHVRTGRGLKGIPHTFRITAYEDLTGANPDPDFQHIYVVVPTRGGHITIDPVADEFDYEVPYIKKRDVHMELQVLSGLGNTGQKYPPGAVNGPDFDDLFGDEAESHFGVASGALPDLSAAQKAALRSGMSPEDWQQKNRLEFIRRNGMTPEQWAAHVQANMGMEEEEDEMSGLGLFRRSRKKKKKKKRGGGGLLNVVNKINKFNPATALLRAGILVAMKINFMNLGRRLRWGGIPYEAAKRLNPRNMTKGKWTKLRTALDKLRTTHKIAGGKRDSLHGSIFYGKGNLGKKIPVKIPANLFPRDTKKPKRLAGFGGLGNLDELDLESNMLEILGPDMIADEGLSHLSGTDGLSGILGVAPAAAIAAATAALTAVAAIIKAIGPVEDQPGAPVPGGLPAETGNPLLDNINKISNTVTTAANTFSQIKRGFQNNEGTNQGGEFQTDNTGTFDETGGGLITIKDDTAKATVRIPDDDGTSEDKSKGKFAEFVSKYKWWLVGGGALTATGITLMIWKPWKKKGKAISDRGGKAPGIATSDRGGKAPGKAALAGTESKSLGKTRKQRSAFTGKVIPALPKGPLKRTGRKPSKSHKKQSVSGIKVP